MSRQKRQLSKSGLYHIIFKGMSRQNIFEEEADYTKLKEIIKNVKEEMGFELYAYCFMTNHVHLFLKEQEIGQISKIMTKILSHYATWFNMKYLRSGALFSNRYKSAPVEDEAYYLALVRYIHQNPVNAHMVSSVGEYLYSSYNEFVENSSEITDIDFSLDMLSKDRKVALQKFIELNKTDEQDSFEISDSRKKSPEAIKRIIMKETGGAEPSAIKSMNKDLRNSLVRKCVSELGISKSALERATGISRGTIVRICNPKAPKPKAAPARRALPQFLD